MPQPISRARIATFVAVFAATWLALSYAGRRVTANENTRIQNGGLSNWELNEELPADYELKTGKLQNGLQYFIRKTKYTEKRAELRLVVNAGSVLETDTQRGLAHAVEHMLFRGTRNFPARSIETFFTSVGMRFGRDLNAWTGYDETVYTMTVPTENIGVLDTGVAILADMAHRATFDPGDARVEGAIVFEEWRRRQYASLRLAERRDSLLTAGTVYALRTVIGDTAVLRKFDVDELIAFYRKWYQPENMAIVLVGDFDASDAEKLVRKHFGEVPANRSRVKPPTIPAPSAGALRVATLTDPEATNATVSFNFIRPARTFRTRRDHRDRLIEMLWTSILERRLEDAADAPHSPLLWAEVERGASARPIEDFEIAADFEDDDALRAADVLATEIARLKEHGVTEGELRDRGEALLNSVSESREWGRSPESLAYAYVQQFLTGTLTLSNSAQYDLTVKALPTISSADLLASAKANLDENNALVLVTLPVRGAKFASTPVHDSTMLQHIRQQLRAPTVARTDVSDTVTLAVAMPPAGTIVSETYRPDIGTFELRLSNGMRVFAKPTDFRETGIQFRMNAPGGTSLANDADHTAAYLSDVTVDAMGVGTLSGLRLDRILDTTSLSFSQLVSSEAVRFSGSLGTRDFERLFQVLHLKMAAPRVDSLAFRKYRAQLLYNATHRHLDPDAVFEDSVALAIGDRRGPATLTDASVVRALTFERPLAFWRARMANASNFTLTLVGNISMPQLRDLLTRYLASLPGGVTEAPRKIDRAFPAAPVHRTILAGAGPRARTRILLSGNTDWTIAASEEMEAVVDIAQRAILERLRQQMGGTYHANVSYRVQRAQPSTYQLSVEFESSPARADSLTTAALAELTRLSTVGPTAQELTDMQLTMARDFDDSQESLEFWADEISSHIEMGWPLASIGMHQQHYREFSLETIRGACARLLSPERFVRVTMLPVPSSQATPVRPMSAAVP
ncbi:MAG: M16 family metallopeptidase [Gemmatimonas sp.]